MEKPNGYDDESEYQAYLKTEHWQRLRSQRLKIDGFRCQNCGRTHPIGVRSLNVHHIRYNAYQEDVYNDLVTLCDQCHKTIHSYRKRIENPNPYVEKIVNFYRFLEKYEWRDYYKNGDLNLCDMRLLSNLAEPFQPVSCTDINMYIANTRKTIIRNLKADGVPEATVLRASKFSKRMIHAIYREEVS